MIKKENFEIFLATAPGLEIALCEEVRTKGFKQPKPVPGGVVTIGSWPDVWRANLWIRGAGRVLARLDSFHVLHLAHLADHARRMPWHSILRPDISFRVEATCSKSRIYHSGAAAQRIETAICETLGATSDPDAEITVMARFERDICTISLDSSGELLHKRGYKTVVNKAPMRETLASLFLRQCNYNGSESVIDPMCGSGTFVIEAAEIAARLNPGRQRRFAFEKFANFDADAWQKMLKVKSERKPQVRFYGSDQDAGAIAISRANAERAGVKECTEFQQLPISDITMPEESPGLIIVNPPYGERIGDRKKLVSLYQTLGDTLKSRFKGWRVGLVTSERGLASATDLPFLPPAAPVQHGGLRVTLYQTKPLS